MILHVLHQDTQFAVLSRDLSRVVPLQVVGGARKQVDGFPVWVIAWLECAVLDLEFVDDKLGMVSEGIPERACAGSMKHRGVNSSLPKLRKR